MLPLIVFIVFCFWRGVLPLYPLLFSGAGVLPFYPFVLGAPWRFFWQMVSMSAKLAD